MPTSYFLPRDLYTMTTAMWAWVNGQIGPGGRLVDMAAAPYLVIWGEQDAVPTAYPFATLRLVEAPRDMGGTPVESLSPDGLYSRREFDSTMVLRVELFRTGPLGPGGVDETQQLVHGLIASLTAPAAYEPLQAAGLAAFLNRQPVSVPGLPGYGRERRTYVDMELRARTRLDTPVVGVMDASTTFPAGATTLAVTADPLATGGVSTPT